MTRILVLLAFAGSLLPGVMRAENPVVPKKADEKKPVVLFIEAMEPVGAAREWRPKETVIKVGDVIEWHVKAGTHGVIFKDWSVASKILKVDTSVSMKIGPQPGFDDPAQGTAAITVKGDQSQLLVRATVMAVPASPRDIEFICTHDKDKMSGKLVFRTDGGNQPR